MFSVIIPLYNKEKYIDKTVNSVLAQTFAQFELIVVNDGSTDESRKQLEAINDPRLIIIDQANVGVSAARNRGVREAAYPWIAFLDADDWWHPDFLQELANLITYYPEAILYGSNYFYVKHGRNRVEEKGLPTDFKAGYIDYLSVYATGFCVLINCSFVVVHKAVFETVGGFRTTLRMGEDIDLWLRLALTGRVAYVNKPLAYSNQDVDAANRAIGAEKLYPPQSHVVFNLSFLKPAEEKMPSLKRLTDGLRVRALLPYVRAGQHTEAVKKVLNDVNFAQQPVRYRLLYWAPGQLLNGYFRVRRIGAAAKRMLLSWGQKTWLTVR